MSSKFHSAPLLFPASAWYWEVHRIHSASLNGWWGSRVHGRESKYAYSGWDTHFHVVEVWGQNFKDKQGSWGRGKGSSSCRCAWGAQGSRAPSQVNSGALRGSRCPEDLSIATMGPQMSWVGRTRLPFLCIAVCVLNRFKREIHTAISQFSGWSRHMFLWANEIGGET